MNDLQRVSKENPPPRIWGIPMEIRRALSGRVGRQRAIAVEGHLVMVLHPVPDRAVPRRAGVYFWRAPDGTWSHSEQGAGFAALERLVGEYEESIFRLEEVHEATGETHERFSIMDRVRPIHRAARSLQETLMHALATSHTDEQRVELQALCDQMSEVERAAELLEMDVQNAIQFSLARQAELQSGLIRAQSRAAHRLNILAAVFLPVATLSSVFGMNLASGLEGLNPLLFWLVLFFATCLGGAIGVFVMNIRSLTPDEW